MGAISDAPCSTLSGVTTVDSRGAILGPLERRVMTRLWADGAQSVREVTERLNAEGVRALAYTTVMTILVRLYKKGFLVRTEEGRRFRYAPAVDEASLSAKVGSGELGRLIRRYGAEAVAEFATDLGEGHLARELASLARTSRRDR